MKRSVIFLLPVFVLALSASAFAQGKPLTQDEDRGDTVGVTVTGGIDFAYIHREGELATLRATNLTWDDDTAVEGTISLRLDIELTESISAVVELSNKYLDGGFIVGTWGDVTENLSVYFNRASVNIDGVFTEQLSMQLGIVPHEFNIRGRGGSVFAPAKSAPLSDYQGVDTSTTLGISGAGQVFNAHDELQPTGLVATYKRDAITFDLFLLPEIDDDSHPSDDEAAYGVDFLYALGGEGSNIEGSQIGVLAVIHALPGAENNMYTIGAGVDLLGLMKGLELWLEIYANLGQLTEAVVAGPTADEIDAGGLAFRFGARYDFENDKKPYVEFKLDYFSGDGDNGGAGTPDTDQDSFIAYENIDDLLILEDQYVGLNVRTNYMAIKLKGGLSFSAGARENNLDVGIVIGICQLVEEMRLSQEVDELGNEVDVNVTYHLSGQASIALDIGYLFGSTVLEGDPDTPGPPGNGYGSGTEDTTWAFSLGVKVDF